MKRGYGFVCRDDNQEDIFIHQSAIVKSNPDHPRKSVGEGEEILFDIVKGAKGNEAANVCASDGNCVKGSQYALRYPRGRSRGRGTFRGKSGYRGRGAPGGVSDDGDMRTQEYFRGNRGRAFRGGRIYDAPYRKPYNYEMPQPYFYEFDYYRGPMRGPRGVFRGRGFRGGPPRDVPMKFESNEYFERRPQGRGRPRGRGRRRGRGRGISRDNAKVNEKEDEDHHESDQGHQD